MSLLHRTIPSKKTLSIPACVCHIFKVFYVCMCVFNISYWVITIYIASFLLFWVETFPFKQFYSIPFYSRTTYVALYFVLGNCFTCHTKSWVLLHVLYICAILFPLPHGSFLFPIFTNLPPSPIVPSPAFTSHVFSPVSINQTQKDKYHLFLFFFFQKLNFIYVHMDDVYEG